MHIPDLNKYNYNLPIQLETVLAIGWLDPSEDFNQGPVPKQIISKLWEIFFFERQGRDLLVNVLRGIHACGFCGFDSLVMGPDEKQHVLGHAEIWIPSGQVWYAAPTMIIHYIEKHQYLPPQEYLEAVRMVDVESLINAQAERVRLVQAGFDNQE